MSNPDPLKASRIAYKRDLLRRAETTALSQDEERQFRAWAQAQGIADVDHPESRYDYRGYWRDVARTGEDQRQAYEDGPHFPDTYKQHGHPSFSVESRYSSGAGDGGFWKGESYVPPDPAAANRARVARLDSLLRLLQQPPR